MIYLVLAGGCIQGGAARICNVRSNEKSDPLRKISEHQKRMRRWRSAQNSMLGLSARFRVGDRMSEGSIWRQGGVSGCRPPGPCRMRF